MKRGTPDHPKTLALMLALDCPKPMAVGLLELLWHFTARYAPQGDIGRWPDSHIAAGVAWPGDPVALVRALVTAGWLDEHVKCRLLVHDWHDHADDGAKKHIQRNNLQFLTGGRRKSRYVATSSDTSGGVTPAVAVTSAIAKPSTELRRPTASDPASEAVRYWSEQSGVVVRSTKVLKSYQARARARLSEGATLEQLKAAVASACVDEFYVRQGYHKNPVVVWKDLGRVQQLAARTGSGEGRQSAVELYQGGLELLGEARERSRDGQAFDADVAARSRIKAGGQG